MAKLQQAVFSFGLPAPAEGADAPDWVHLLPAGTFSGRDGRGPYKLTDPEGVIAASMAEGEIPLDYSHGLVGPVGSQQVPAAGWITQMQSREDGIWGKVSWTPKGEQAVADREYRNLSPVFLHEKDGTVRQIMNAGLVNNPNLYLQAVAQRQDGRDDGGADMAELKDLAKKLGLPETATVEEISAKIDEQKAARDAELKAVADAVGHTGEVSANAIVAHARSLKATGAAEPDPAKFVPMSQFTELSTSLAGMQEREAAREAELAVNAATTAGKVTPAQRDWALAYARKDPAGFKDYVEKAAVIVQPGPAAAHAAGGAPGGERQLTAQDLAVCQSMGLDPEAYKKTLQQEIA